MTRSPDAWRRLLIGLGLAYGVFQWSAAALGSARGEAGIAVGALVVLACIAAERLLFGRTLRQAASDLGLGTPASRGMAAAAIISLALLLVLVVYVIASGARVEWYTRWPWLIPGLFAQAGIAEETLFRGYLFRHLRKGRTFWRAALVATVPFTIVHLILFLTLPWPIALASVLLAACVGFPLARLFELSGRTIWAPALVHFTIQGAIKIIVVSGRAGELLPIVWMVACAVLPFSVFLERGGAKPVGTD